MTGYIGNIENLTKQNTHFRQVVFTSTHNQLVVMSLLEGEEIGEETHLEIEGMAAVVPAGAKHNLINVGPGSLKLYTLYSPPNHPPMTIHHTKAEAQKSE